MTEAEIRRKVALMYGHLNLLLDAGELTLREYGKQVWDLAEWARAKRKQNEGQST
jgi:hypothetical protein